jgi:hypothetical protein
MVEALSVETEDRALDPLGSAEQKHPPIDRHATCIVAAFLAGAAR